MLKDAEMSEEQAIGEQDRAKEERIEVLARAKAQTVKVRSGKSFSQLLPSASFQQSRAPPLTLHPTGDKLACLIAMTRGTSSAASPTTRTWRLSSSAASTTTKSTPSRRGGIVRVRASGSKGDVLEVHRRPRPRTIWGGPAWS